MDASTRHRLLDLNRRFYARHATAFSRTRQRPWPGWTRLWDGLLERGQAPPGRVLDVGCGNGRFGLFLADHLTAHRPVAYAGVDAEPALLAAARTALSPCVAGGRLARADLLAVDVAALDAVGEAPSALLARLVARRHLVVLFGVLHHLPGEAQRRQLLCTLGAALDAGAWLVASWWMAHRGPGFARKTLGVEAYLPGAELEPGDALLGWAGDLTTPRYCHFPTDAELERGRELPGLELADTFLADGPSGEDNLYLVWRRADRPA